MEKGLVAFKYRDRKDKDKEKIETINAEEFIRRFLLHILPSRFMRIRHYGFLCNCYKKKNIKRIRELIGEPFKQEEESREAPLERLQRLMGVDFTRCPHCKEGTMVVVKEIPGRRIHKGRNPAVYEDTS